VSATLFAAPARAVDYDCESTAECQEYLVCDSTPIAGCSQYGCTPAPEGSMKFCNYQQTPCDEHRAFSPMCIAPEPLPPRCFPNGMIDTGVAGFEHLDGEPYPPDREEGGCSIVTARSAGSPFALWVALGAAWFARRSRKPGRSAGRATRSRSMVV
jgi:hypothetical protein